MAKRRKTNRKMSRGGRVALAVFIALLLALALFCGGAALNAGVVRVRRAEVQLRDLPAAFEGKTLLYASDIDLCGMNTGARSGALFSKLQELKPDMLILGGDYTSPSLLKVLNRGSDADGRDLRQLRDRTDFFLYIKDFEAPLGKFGIAAPEDPEQEMLANLMLDAGITPLFNNRAPVTIGGDTLWIIGVSRETANLNSAGSAFSRGDCVLVAAYSPAVLPVLATSEAQDGGRWADLALTGHTHGGQVRLFGRDLLNLTTTERQYRAGWTMENGLPILTTQGVGCEGVNLRVGTEPEVWLITLMRAAD